MFPGRNDGDWPKTGIPKEELTPKWWRWACLGMCLFVLLGWLLWS